MSQSGSGTPTLGRSVPCMARRDDEEQLPSSNDIASSSNGTTSNLLLSLNNPNKKFLPASSLRLRRYSGDGNDLHDQKRQCVRIVKTRVEIALSNNGLYPLLVVIRLTAAPSIELLRQIL